MTGRLVTAFQLVMIPPGQTRSSRSTGDGPSERTIDFVPAGVSMAGRGQCPHSLPGVFRSGDLSRGANPHLSRANLAISNPGQSIAGPGRLSDDLPRRDARYRDARSRWPDPRHAEPLRPSREPRLPQTARPRRRFDLRLSCLAL